VGIPTVVACDFDGMCRKETPRMGDYLSFFEGLSARLQGPMHFRFILQPLIALFFAIRDGRRDAREGRPPYFWALFTEPEHRRDMLASGWKSVGKVFIIAIVLDLVFQYIALRAFHPVAAVLAGVLLALVPYLLLRGPVNRLMRRTPKGEKS
jgi:hypothetical protein